MMCRLNLHPVGEHRCRVHIDDLRTLADEMRRCSRVQDGVIDNSSHVSFVESFVAMFAVVEAVMMDQRLPRLSLCDGRCFMAVQGCEGLKEE